MENDGNKLDGPGTIFDSTRMSIVGKEKKNELPGYYFPLVAGIILVELAVLIFVLLDIIPIHPFEIYPTAAYFSLIGVNDLSQIGVVITRWFFFLLTAGVLSTHHFDYYP